MSEFIKVYSKSDISSMSDVRYIFGKIKKAIGTWLLPTQFDSIQEFVEEFYKINFGRSFGSGFYSEAGLQLCIYSHSLSFCYDSTSGTNVTLEIKFNDEQQFESAEIEVYLPSDRIGHGRCHYEALTKELLTYEFSRDAKNNPKKWVYCKPEGLPIPNWVLDRMSNLAFSAEKANKDLGRYGFTPTTAPGYTDAWMKFDEEGITWVLRADRGTRYDGNDFVLIKSVNGESDFPSEYSWKSYRQLLNSLRREQLEPEETETPSVFPEEDTEDYELEVESTDALTDDDE